MSSSPSDPLPLTEAHPQARPYLPNNPLCPLLCRSLERVGGYVSRESAHFRVYERPLYPASGDGTHAFTLVLKEGRTTEEATQSLARGSGVSAREIGYAGRKDKDALTTQWMTLPCSPTQVKSADPQVIPLLSRPHERKLKLGHLQGNLFSIFITGVDSVDRLAPHFTALQRGIPNYFGRQRFGRTWYVHKPPPEYTPLVDEEGRPLQDPLLPAQDNVDRAIRALSQPRRKTREVKLLLSAMQSALFNLWLGERINDGLLHEVIEGDVCRKVSGGTFYSTEPEVDTQRLLRGEIDILGPLVGPKLFPSRGRAHEREEALYAQWGLTDSMRASLGKSWRGDRRRSTLRLSNLKVFEERDGIWLHFSLPKGAYATTVLTELLQPQGAFERGVPPLGDRVRSV